MQHEMQHEDDTILIENKNPHPEYCNPKQHML